VSFIRVTMKIAFHWREY